MGKISKSIALIIFFCFGISHGAEYDIKTITTIMDAYEKQVDSIKLKYSYESFISIDKEGKPNKEGNRNFTKGIFAKKNSEGFILLDEVSQEGKTWNNDKEPEGIARSYNGKVTRYLEHEKNNRGYHMAALYENHNQKLYKTTENPYYRVWGNNYKHKFKDRLNDPNNMAKIQGEELVDGLKAIKISFIIKSDSGVFNCYLWLLPEKNYLPIKWLIYKPDGGRLQEMHWSEFKEFTGGIWYPMNIKLYLQHIEDPVTFKIEEMDISPLTKEDFDFKFPAFTHVTDHLIGTSYLTTMTMEQSGVEDAPLQSSLSNKEKEKVLDKYLESSETTNSKDSNVVDTGVKLKAKANLKEKSTEVPYWIIMLALILVVIGIIFISTRRKRP
ncbi:MAG: hypothetical protein H8D47_02150 [Planctomycetes bacterium]|nr:hypothetical protein [Planctomycetota bacterium]